MNIRSALNPQCSTLPLVDALCPQSVNSVYVRDVEQRFISRRVCRQLHQHLVEEDGLKGGDNHPAVKAVSWWAVPQRLGAHRLVHAVLQVRLGGEDFVQARRPQRFGHL